jgi:hypothetical protein
MFNGAYCQDCMLQLNAELCSWIAVLLSPLYLATRWLSVTVWHCLTAFCALNCQIIRLDKLFILCDCKTLAKWVILVWNQVTLKTSLSKILHFVQGVGLLNEWAKGPHKWLFTGYVRSSLRSLPFCILFCSILIFSKCQFHSPFSNSVRYSHSI